MSILRYYQNNWYKKNSITGVTLDLGNKNPNADYLKCHKESISELLFTDIYNRNRNDVIVQDFNLPFSNKYHNKFDTILCYNVLEHVFNYQQLITSIHELLKEDGTAYITVPFLYKVHGDPDDFHRFTKSSLILNFEERHFYVEVTETACGPFHVIINTMTNLLGPWTVTPGAYLARIIDKFLGVFFNIKPYALGYNIVAKKNKNSHYNYTR